MSFVGYIVANDREEFLAGYRKLRLDSAWFAWALSPGFALVFATMSQARRIVRREQRYAGELVVRKLWDAGAYWVVEQHEGQAA